MYGYGNSYNSSHYNCKCENCGAFGSTWDRIDHKKGCYWHPNYEKQPEPEPEPEPKEMVFPQEEEKLAMKIANFLSQLLGKQ